jgi:hypothetical protein
MYKDLKKNHKKNLKHALKIIDSFDYNKGNHNNDDKAIK